MNRAEEQSMKAGFDRVLSIIIMARKENRPLSDQEKRIVGEFRGILDGDVSRLPANRPLTQPGPDGGSSSGPKVFGSFGEQLSSVVRAGLPGGQVDQRLFQVRAATGMGETVPSDGGFLVQTDYSNDLLQQVYQTGILLPRCRRFQISGNSNSIKLNAFDETSRASTRLGGIIGYWKDEAAQITASKPKFRQMELNLKKLTGVCYVTDELVNDVVALESVVSQGFVSEFGFLIDDAIINGTGAGQPLGILNAGCLVSVAKESGQRAATVVYENIVKMYARLLPGSEQSAVWLVNRNVLPQLYSMSLAVGTGGVPVFTPANGISGLPYNTLFGKPVIAIEQAATLGTVGDIVLADLSNYVIAEKGGIEAASSVHVQFLYDEMVLRFILRIDGQPSMAAALTPHKGSDSLSPFVALVTRA